jgi:outer membrane protein OmpA-like peptidoglycan-associated protein
VTSFNVMFDKKKGAVLNAEEHAKIVEAADALKGGAPSVTIEASGSGTGDPAADEELSQTRGRRVAEELEKLGVPPEKIAVTSQPDGGATVTATQ